MKAESKKVLTQCVKYIAAFWLLVGTLQWFRSPRTVYPWSPQLDAAINGVAELALVPSFVMLIASAFGVGFFSKGHPLRKMAAIFLVLSLVFLAFSVSQVFFKAFTPAAQ